MQHSHMNVKNTMIIINASCVKNDTTYDGFHTYENEHGEVCLNDTILFCTQGYEFNCPIEHCCKIDKQRSRKFKKSTLNNYQKNSLILTNWPFSHPPKTTAFDKIKLLHIEFNSI